MKESIDKLDMLIEFKALGQEALSMNHYDLYALCPKYSVDKWLTFLQEPDIQEYIKKEMAIIRTSQVNKLVQESGKSRSVGQAQLLNALQKFDEDEQKADGPIFIYCYVPLNDEQKHAPNVQEVDEFGRPKA